MIFVRSVPKRIYRDYTRYRELLRSDFQYRCAYCLIPEYHNGGSANFAIDHFLPVRGVFGRPDLEANYRNLYWCCLECNQNKADQYPDPRQEAQGYRWIDPCEAWGDHSLHWQFDAAGEVHWLSPAGEYTGINLRFHEREGLKAYWRKFHRVLSMRENVETLLKEESLSELLQQTLRGQLSEFDEFLDPPVFKQVRRASSPAR